MSNEELVVVIQTGASEYMSELWEQVHGLILWKARHIMMALDLRGNLCGTELEDLIQSGYLALVKAVETYKPDDGAFSTWLIYHLKNTFAEVTGYRTQRGQNDPINNSISLDKPIDDEQDGAAFGDFVSDPQAADAIMSVEERLWQEQLHEALETALAELSQESADILRLRHYQGLTLAAAGEVCGTTAEQIRKTEEKAIRQLRKPKIARNLMPFYDFDFYCGTGLGAFRKTGASIQERYLMTEDDQKEKEAACVKT